MKNQIKALLAICGLTVSMHSYAECFVASGKAMTDAQTIRKSAVELGWKVGKTASIAAGTFIKGKVALYPQGDIQVCLRVNKSDELVFKAQSSSSDAGEAEWRNLHGKKK